MMAGTYHLITPRPVHQSVCGRLWRSAAIRALPYSRISNGPTISVSRAPRRLISTLISMSRAHHEIWRDEAQRSCQLHWSVQWVVTRHCLTLSLTLETCRGNVAGPDGGARHGVALRLHVSNVFIMKTCPKFGCMSSLCLVSLLTRKPKTAGLDSV
jgi:hypothetical protein